MSTAAPLQALTAKPQPISSSAHAGLLLQRKCACGSPAASLTGECSECKSKKLLQAKLTIGASNDPLEQEADRVANRVLAAPTYPAVRGAPLHMQRLAGQATGGSDIAPASVDRVLASSGRPLDPALRQDMEQRFGHDFSRVRVHSGGEAEQSARDVNANAYTVGHDIAFGAGQFVPGSQTGRRLIAHELTHVVQQSGTEGICGVHSNVSLPSISPTILQKQDADKSDDKRFLRSMESKEIAEDCPDFDDVVLDWIYQKAEPFIQNSYKGLNSVVVITSRKTWKKPSEWGELDVDINFRKMSQDASPEEILNPEEGLQQHVKLTAQFTKFADGLHVVGELIDWLDGHAIVRQNWEGVVITDRVLALFGYTCKQTKIRDFSKPEPPRRIQKTKDKKRVQAKLAIGGSNDPLEREADRIADQVMAASAHSPVSAALPHIQRYTGQASEGSGYAPASVDRVLAGSGRPLEPALRQDMEQRFGRDFSRVRVHSGTAPEKSARDVSANAYTVGHNIVFGAGQFAPQTREGQRLLAHELTHVLQQSGADGFRAGQSNQRLARTPITHEQDPFPARDVLRARPESRPEPSRVAACAATVLERQRVAGNQVVAGILQRQDTAPSGPAAAPGGKPVGDAVQAEVESLLKTFAAAKGYEAQNAAAMDAVRAIIRSYSMSTKGVRTMRFKPDLDPKHTAETGQVKGNDRESEIDFGPTSFSQGFAFLVHIVAHELEHVRQNLIGGYHRGDEVEAVSEFLAYTGMVLQVQTVPGAAGRGFLGALKAGTGHSAPALPPLPPDQLADRAEQALSMFSRMSSEDQKKRQYRQEFAAAGAKLFERLKTEAPRGLRPPTKFTPEWAPWYEGQAPTLDILTPEYQEWQDALKSPWNRVKGVWKQFDAAFKIR